MALLEPCDLFFTHGDSLLGYLIRRATRARNEPPSWANHVGMVVEAGEGMEAVVVEALATVQRHRLADQYQGSATEIVVYRPLNLTAGQKEAILRYAAASVGQRYGYSKIALHFLAWVLHAPFLLNLSFLHQRPICSYLIAHCFRAATPPLGFGLNADVVSPDDMLDFCAENGDKYQLVVRWEIS